MKRGLLPLASVLALIALTGLVGWRAMNPIRLRTENFTRIERGMTLDQVEELMGGAPGNYGKNSGGGFMTLEGFMSEEPTTEMAWSDDSNRFEVYFNAKKLVVATHKRSGYKQYPKPWLLLWLWDLARYRLGI